MITNKKILIVDDEKQTRSMIERALKKLWPEVVTAEASDGIQALRVAKEFLPDIIVLDLMLPGQDGFQVLSALQHNPRLREMLVLGITAYNSPENIKKLINHGAMSCLTKPFGPEELSRFLSPYLGKDGEKENSSSIEGSLKIAKGSRAKLLNITAFMGLLMSTLSLPNPIQGSNSKMARNTQMEEPYRKNRAMGKIAIAVVPFESSNRYISGKAFSEVLSDYLTKRVKGIQVIERLDIEKVLSEQKFALTGAVKQENADKTGQIEAVDALVMGTVRVLEQFQDEGGAIVVNIKVVDVTSGKILWKDKQESRYYSVGIDREALAEELIDRAAKKVAKRIKSKFLSTMKENTKNIG